MSKSLFLLKLREDYNTDPSYSAPVYSSSSNQYSAPFHIATGMYNSAKFVVDTLNSNNVQAGLGLIEDGNAIDAAVVAYNPTHVFIEGLWVTPAKFAELMALRRHAGRTWIVRIHSEIPFLASEGIAMSWIGQYLKMGVKVASNAPRATEQLIYEGASSTTPSGQNAFYLPNCYPVDFLNSPPVLNKVAIDIGCFGAFRPLKNQLQQAFAALKFAQWIGKPLNFHINGRVDAGGQGAMNNVIGLFNQIDPAIGKIVNHEWESRELFLQTLSEMDMLMQVSMSETFNIVAADAVLVGIPVIASDEIPWYYSTSVDPQSVKDIFEKMQVIWNNRTFFITKNRIGLARYSATATQKWLAYLQP